MDRRTWMLNENEDFHCESFLEVATGEVRWITIIPRCREEQVAHYLTEGLLPIVVEEG